MEDTQTVNWEDEEEEETERSNGSLECSLEPLGQLHIFSSTYGPEKDFPLYLGKNVVGRMPDCSVALPFPSISKQHAVIEILAWDKAPVLWDCGSLNGTQILRPPKFLSPGVSHRLRDQELVVFADLPCQYHRLDVSLPFVSRVPLTVEETPRVQGGTQPWGVLLAEDSEEEVDPLSERYVMNEPRTMSSLLATVVPESDEEGPSTPYVPEPPDAFNFDSDTDEEERQQPATGQASSAATRDATAKTEQPKAIRTEIQVEKYQSLGQERNSDIRVKRDANNGEILERSQPSGDDSETDVDDESRPPGKPAEGHLERAQPSGFIDSDTDVEEEGIPTTPTVVPMKRRQIFHGVNAESPRGPDLAHVHESPAGSETDVEETEASLTVPLERSQASMVSDSNVNDKEQVSVALTLAHLMESQTTGWNRDTDVEEDRAQSPAFLEQSQTSAGRDSDTDMELEGFSVEKRDYVPKSHTNKAQTEKCCQFPFGNSDRKVEEDKSSPRVLLERSQVSATVGINTQVEEEVSPGPAVTLLEKHEVPLACTNPINVEAEGDPAKLPAMRLEEARPPPGTAGEPTQAQRKGAPTPRESWGEPHVDMTRNSGHSQNEVLSMEEEPTQAFLFTLHQEPGPSHCSFQASGALDEPWEVLATQPFCLRESETQPIAAHLEAHGSCPFSPRPTPQDNHLESPFRAEPLGIQDGGMQTAEKGHLNYKMSPAAKASRGDPGSLDGCLPPAIPEASAPVQNPLMPQSQKHLASQPLFAPSPPLELPISSSRQNGSQKAVENPLSSELDSLHVKPTCRPQGYSRVTPFPASSVAPDLEPPAPTDHPVTPEFRPATSTEQPVTPEPTSRATRGRTHRASIKTPEPTVPTDQLVTPEPTSRATRGRTHRASVKTPEPTIPTDQLVTPEPTSRATRGRTHRASVKTPEPTVPTGPDLEPPAPTDQPVTPKAIALGGQSRTPRSTRSAVPVPTTCEFQSPFPQDQPISPEAIPQANCSRRPRVTRKPLAAPIVCEPCSAPLEPNAWSSRSQRQGAVRATKSLRTIPKPAFAQLPGAPTHALQIQKVEATGRYEFSPESQPKAFQNHKRPSDTVDSPPLPKRLRKEVPQKTVFLKEEEEEKPGKEEDVVLPGPGKRKRDQAEEEPKGIPVRSLRRNKPNHESTAPKVLFTGVVDTRGEQTVLALGGILANSVAEASHLVTDRICRTVKFLCALGRGIPILSLDWLYQSHKAGCFLPPDEYVVTDPEQEKNFGFSLRDSLSRARERRLLEGYEIHVTPGVQPPPPQMGEIISCCGGTVLPSMPRSYKPRRVVITCSQDAPRCTTPFRVGLPILSPEFLLTGVLKQEANPEAFVLSTLEMSSP